MNGSAAVLAIALAALPADALGDAPPAFASPIDSGGRYETVVHARPRRDAGVSLVLTARDLERRGVDNLAEALDLIPELSVRQGGRGEVRLDVRGAKQRDVLVLIDGVPVDEPYFGSFDLSSIPVTDIVEIRVTLSPASPLEGPGGPGGIVEVMTLAASGGRRVSARLQASSTPDVQAAVTGRGDVARWLSMRASGGGRYGEGHYPIVGPIDQGGQPGIFNDRAEAAHGSLRLEHVSRFGRVTVDGWAEHRSYFVPPTDTNGASLQAVRDETAARVVLGAEITPGPWRFAIGAYTDLITRSTDFYSDITERNKTGHEDLFSDRAGAAAHLDRQLGRYVLLSARLSFDSELANIADSGVKPIAARVTFAELAAGGTLRWRWLRVEAAIGAAAPIGNRADPWPEAKLAVSFALAPSLSLRLTGARKGRLPTLRELYAPMQGNSNLNPEQSSFAEVQVMARPFKLLTARVSVYYRYTQGLIRLDSTRSVFSNLDDITVRGIEATVEVAREKLFGGGATYLFADASSPSPVLGLTPIENFPRHRFDAWLTVNWRAQAGGLLRFRYIGAREDQGNPLPDYEVLDLSAWWRIRRELRATARVDNVTDNRYLVRTGVASLGRVFAASLEGVFE